MKKLSIVCLSTQLWEDPMWTNKQHIMSRLAKRGHSILYVDPLIRARKFFKHVLLGRYTPRRFITFVKSLDNNLWLYSPVKLLFSEERETNFNIRRINSLIKNFFVGEPILWVYDPEFADYVDKISYEVLIYDCVDDYSEFPEGRYPQGREWLLKKEKKLVTQANIVFATSKNLYEKRKKMNPNTYYTPNVADFEHNQKALSAKTEIPEDIKSIKRPIIGFQGALADYKIDLNLLQKLAQTHSEWSLVLIGPKAQVDPKTNLKNLKSLKNVHFLGLKPYEKLPNYYKAFDVAIIPYVLNEYTKSVFPLKFFEYLGAGCPVVTTDLPALAEYKNQEIAFFAKDATEFISLINTLVKTDPNVGLEKRLAVARQNSWEGKIDSMLDILSKEIED